MDADRRRVHASRNAGRRRVIVVILIALLPFASVAWFLRGRWLPGAESDRVVADSIGPQEAPRAEPLPASGDERAHDSPRTGGVEASLGAGRRSAPRVAAGAPMRSDAGDRPSSGTDAALVAVPPGESLPTYRAVAHLTGRLRSVGSDTLNSLMQFWAEGFHARYPDVEFEIEGKGSATAPPALTAGVADVGPMAREMNARESGAFEERHGYRPIPVLVAFDALAIYVHKDNPITQLTLAQVDAMFSSTRRAGGPSDITSWGQLGLTGDWASKPISLYGRNSASGTYGYFKERVLAKGDYKATVKEQPGSAAVVRGVSDDLGGCGYGGIGYETSGVRVVPIVGEHGEPVLPTVAEIRAARYPISRSLWIYVNRQPGAPLPKFVSEFLLYVLSRDGAEAVVKDGFTALDPVAAAAERRKFD